MPFAGHHACALIFSMAISCVCHMQVGALRDIKSELAVRRDALQQGIIAQIETQVSPTPHAVLV